jgi:hypothetical protein
MASCVLTCRKNPNKQKILIPPPFHPFSPLSFNSLIEYDKQDQQGKAAFNERNPHMTQQQEPMARSPGGPQTKTGQGKDRARTG